MALTIGDLVGYLKLDDSGWSRSLRTAKDELDKFDKDIGSFVDRSGKNFLTFANTLSNIPTAVQAVSGVATVAVQASGALGLLPAAGVAVGAAMATAKVGMQGFSDALSAMDDPKKFAEALETLSPAARDAAIAVRDLGPAWEQAQNAVQEELFAEMGDVIRQVGGSYIPILRDGMVGVASSMGVAAAGVSHFLMEARTMNDVRTIFDNTEAAVAELAGGTQPLLSIFRDVAAVGSEFLPGLVSGFGDAAQSAADFVSHARETGELSEWISQGLSTLGELWTLLKNIAGIAGTVFSAFDASGVTFLQTLITITGKVKEFLQSVEGQQALHALASALATVSTVATSVLLTALRQLAPIIVALAPGFAELARQVGQMLVQALQLVGPLLLQMATFISDNIGWLGPLAIALYAAVQAFQVVTAAIKVFNVISSLNPWVVIIAATIALVTLIVTHWDQIVAFLAKAWDWIVNAAKTAWDWVVNIVQGAIDWIVNAFLNWTLPGLIIKHWDTIVNAVRTAVNWVIDAVGWLGELPGRVGSWFRSVYDAAVRALGDLINWLGGLPGRILGALGDLGSLLWNAGVEILNGLLDGLKSAWNSVAGWVSDVAGWIASLKGPLSYDRKLLVPAGQAIMGGLQTGLEKGWSPVASLVGGMGDQIAASMTAPGFAFTGSATGTANGMSGNSGALVHIENYQPPADASAYQVASDLDWFARGAG